MSTPSTDILTGLAETFDTRSRNAGWRGKKRSEMAVEFFCGAADALAATGNPEAQRVLIFLSMALCPRGASEIDRILARGK